MLFENIIKSQRTDKKLGVTSICSANQFVIEAALEFAKKNETVVLIEATSNQVDQFGGYTGMTPELFRDFVYNIASELSFPKERIILGGDHLGPNRWKNLPAEEAMLNAEEQIRAYVRAGFKKIHLDTSFLLGGDSKDSKGNLAPEIITKRAARLCAVAEEEVNKSIVTVVEKPVYVIGTDVPIPGGAEANEILEHITTADELEETISLSKNAFEEKRLSDAWQRVIAVVVQPGVEFSDNNVFGYNSENITSLKSKIEEYDFINFEAHSTDYQTPEALKQMVEDHFMILKVGPWLTYSMREAIFSLYFIEEQLFANKSDVRSNLLSVIKSEMDKSPGNWENYYHGTEDEISLAKYFSYSDRIRYYWNNERISDALSRLFNNLNEKEIPETLLSQYLPVQYQLIVDNEIKKDPRSLVISKITEVISKYHFATN